VSHQGTGPALDPPLNDVHNVNMIQAGERRGRVRAARRDVFLDVTRALIEDHGIEALTIKAVAERVDCAVGTLYTYFSSKGALVAAVQAEAIASLGAAYDGAAELIEEDLGRLGLGVDEAALARLVAFGRSIIAVGQVLPEEFRLQQRMLDTSTTYEPADLAVVAPVAFEVLARPERLLREAVALGVIDAGDAFDRTIVWVAAINGVLSLRLVEVPGPERLEPMALADRLHLDLLAGWGARPATLAAAERAVPVERMRHLLEESTRP
jgi:AcrR family transcriptional regulator